MTPYEYLRHMPETMPSWLSDFRNGQPFNRDAFFASRVVYYPGSGNDGHAVKLFGSTHSAHTFVYVDYGEAEQRIVENLDHPMHGFTGYTSLARVRIEESELAPKGWTPHVDPGDGPRNNPYSFASAQPFGLLEILQRDEGFDDTHGPSRLAILFLGADGIATYDALFCQRNSTAKPFAVLLQDHGFGGNYDRFGKGGLLAKVAHRCNVLPDLLLVGESTHPWEGFERIPEVEGDRGGGWHLFDRFLYKRCAG